MGVNRFRRLVSRFGVLALVTCGGAAVVSPFADATAQTTARTSGVVVVKTELAYQGGESAGTGIVLTSSGEILTNNHVIRGASTVKIVLPGVGRSYPAKVIGYDTTADVAVLEAIGASNLDTVLLGNSSAVKVGEPVIATGNADGAGSLVSTSGRVTGIAKAVSISDDEGGGESLTGLIAMNAGLESGDSGGPLMNAADEVVGIDTAASIGYRTGQGGLSTGPNYAIPINRALAIAAQIESGTSSASIHIGPTAFLGVELDSAPTEAGAQVEGVAPRSPAAAAGLAVGDWITAIDGHTITSAATLESTLVGEKVGVPVSLRYVDARGATKTARVTFKSGAPQ
jgi:S1-C subfamily serine protease